MKPWPISAYTVTSALGVGCASHVVALQTGQTGLKPTRFMNAPLPTWTGEVAGIDNLAMPPSCVDFDCRNNRLAWWGLQQDGFFNAVDRARQRWGAHRVAVLLGTSTSGLLETELAYRRRNSQGALPADYSYAHTQNAQSLATFTREVLQLRGPSWVVSTACSSSAKVFGSAARLIACGVVDAAVVGGVDTLCLSTLYGFNALELLSPDICRPWDIQRQGLSLGEAAAFALLERSSEAPEGWLLGVGESNDGHHMSTPHPQGAGAILAMQAALAEAQLRPAQIDYINLHGTATPSNDAAENMAVSQVFGSGVPCSSTKGATGHTLGAAGGVEAVISLLALKHGFIPGGLNLRTPDPHLQAHYVSASRPTELRHVASNSFGFGGSNACLIFGHT